MPHLADATAHPRVGTPRPMLPRNEIIERLASELPLDGAIRGAWLGGSDATGRTDELSDIDLMLIVRPGAIETAADVVEQSLLQLSPIRCKLRMPMPSWHGCHQCFYQLQLAPEHLMIDWLMIEQGQKHPWLEVERHGTPRVLFDKDGDITPAHSDTDALRAAASKKIDELRARFAMFKHLPPKLARRGLAPDAAYFYQALILRPLVDLLRARYCPERHDYGFRYLNHDLPRELYEEVSRLCYPPSIDAIPTFALDAERLFESTLSQN